MYFFSVVCKKCLHISLSTQKFCSPNFASTFFAVLPPPSLFVFRHRYRQKSKIVDCACSNLIPADPHQPQPKTKWLEFLEKKNSKSILDKRSWIWTKFSNQIMNLVRCKSCWGDFLKWNLNQFVLLSQLNKYQYYFYRSKRTPDSNKSLLSLDVNQNPSSRIAT